MTPLCPLQLAERLHTVRNMGPQTAPGPRQIEALNFILHASHQPGGLDEMARALIKKYPEHFTSREMRAAGEPQSGQWTLNQCLGFWPKAVQKNLYHDMRRRQWPSDFVDWWMQMTGDAHPADPLTVESFRKRGSAARVGFEKYNCKFFHDACIEKAGDELAAQLAEFCRSLPTGPCDGFTWLNPPSVDWACPWYCPTLFEVLFAYMDAHAKAVESTITPTKVKQIIFRELAFSISERVPVQFIGNSRFGKTTAAAVWSAMWPGRARYIRVPPENRKKDFLLSHADALHYKPVRSIGLSQLDRDIQFIVRQCGLFLAYDESQWLLPAVYTKDTKAWRLNWIRAHIIGEAHDQPKTGGCAFFATKQSHKEDLSKFIKKTGFVLEQWLGRMAPVVELPDDVDRDSLLAVAQQNFPDIKLPLLKLIAARAMQSEGLLHHIEITSKRARFIAREAGRPVPIQADVEAAIADMMPMPHTGRPQSPHSRPDCTPAAEAPPQSRRVAEAALAGHNRISSPTTSALAVV